MAGLLGVAGVFALIQAAVSPLVPTLVQINDVPPSSQLPGETHGFQNGRLARFAFIDLVGTSDQIHDVKADAETGCWRIDCEAKSGPWSTMRLGFPRGTRQVDIDGYFVTGLSKPARVAAFKMGLNGKRSSNCIDSF